MDYENLAQLLFPNVNITEEELEVKYPARSLPEGAIVSRMAPSPTGFVHLGNLVQGITSEKMAHSTGGVLFLRVEDTDQKREVEGAVEVLIDTLSQYDINFDEGATITGDNGAYGPYRQRQRENIYHVYAKKLVSEGKAYPCFCSEEKLALIRAEQESLKENFGYYGKWAIWRDKSIEEIKEMLSSGAPWVLRFRSEGNIEHKIKFKDLIKGEIELTENDIDIVLLKSDGIPTYHFAHAVDDHLMRTTHVVRGDEWLPSLPVHIQLFSALHFKLPKYLHIGPLMKMDGSSKRKLSKRKDPELALTFYREQGYPIESVYEYILTILNSNFEDWRRANPTQDVSEFPFSYKKMNPAGSLFDSAKLHDVSKDVIAAMSAQKVYELSLSWAEEFDQDFAKVLSADREYSEKIFAIGRGGKKPRKDIAVLSEVKDYTGLFFEEYFDFIDEYPQDFDKGVIKAVLRKYAEIYDEKLEMNEWFEQIKALCPSFGFAEDTKLYKQSPESYKGSVADVSMFIRLAVTGKLNSPDMYSVMHIIGKERSLDRIEKMIEKL